MLKEYFVPDSNLDHLSKKALEELIEKQNLDYLIFDVDGVLTPFHGDVLDPNVVNVLKLVQITKYVVSNRISTQEQYWKNRNLAEKIQEIPADIIVGYKKPFADLSNIGLTRNGAVIGDTLFFDVLFAKRNGLYSILVKPLQPSPLGMNVYRRSEKVLSLLTKL